MLCRIAASSVASRSCLLLMFIKDQSQTPDHLRCRMIQRLLFRFSIFPFYSMTISTDWMFVFVCESCPAVRPLCCQSVYGSSVVCFCEASTNMSGIKLRRFLWSRINEWSCFSVSCWNILSVWWFTSIQEHFVAAVQCWTTSSLMRQPVMFICSKVLL